MPTRSVNSQLESQAVDKKEALKVEKRIRAKEAAPSFSEQSGTFVDWQQIRDQLGQPFTFDPAPPLRKLKQMAKDPMLRFALHFITTPHVRAPYHMEARDKNGNRPDISAFYFNAWKEIHAGYIMKSLLSLRWGHQPIVKRYWEANPGGVWYDLTEEDPENQAKPVWNEGKILPIIWKDFVPLDPGRCQPIFSDSNGEFAGIQYEVPASDRRKKSNAGSGNPSPFREIDVERSLWITYGRDDQFGSIYGYPRIAHAFRFWWSYWYAWAMIDRAIERMAVPPMLARHPEGDFEDPDDPTLHRPYWEVALDAAERLRSNAIAAIPSTLASSGLEERGTQQYEWDFSFLETTNAPIEEMIKFAEYCDVMKVRSLWVPERAFMEGQGGKASGAVAERMGEAHVESQANLWEENIAHVNRYVIPQLLLINHPEFVNNGGTCRIVGHGFAKEDIELLKQLIQLVGQADPNKLGVDIRTGLERLGVPLMTPEQQAQETRRLAQEAAAIQPPVVPGQTATVGQLNGAGSFTPGQTNGGSVPEPNAPGASTLGFDDVVYFQAGDSISLSESEDYITSLPTTPHYSDKTMRALSLQLRRLWKAHISQIYPELARHINGADLKLADEPPRRQTVTKKKAEHAAKTLLSNWAVGSKRMEQLGEQSKNIIAKMVQRAAKMSAKQANLAASLTDEQYQEWVSAQTLKLMAKVHATIRDEVLNFLTNEIREGKTAAEIATSVNEHFSDITTTKADKIARSETRDAFNAGTLMIGESAELKYARASDGTDFDEYCRKRNGKLFTIKEAWKEMSWDRTHPNDTLSFELVARADFSVETVPEMPENAPENAWVFFDDQTSTIYIDRESDIEAADRVVSSIVDQLIKEGYHES